MSTEHETETSFDELLEPVNHRRRLASGSSRKQRIGSCGIADFFARLARARKGF